MDIVARQVLKEGKEETEFVLRCPDHNSYYTRRPPLTHGCRECWMVFLVGDWIERGATIADVEELEAVINHVKEEVEKGNFDFTPGRPEIEYN